MESIRLDNVRSTLQETASRIRLNRSRYSNVNALLLYWESDHDPEVASAVNELASVLRNDYHYTCESTPIPRNPDGASPFLWLHRKLVNEFITKNDRETLSIVYYIGMSYLDSNNQMVIARIMQWPGAIGTAQIL